MGERQVVVARELTKFYEELLRGTVSDVLECVEKGKVRGEVVILVAPGEALVQESEPLDALLLRLMKEERLSVKDAARQASEITGVSRNKAYSEALQLRSSSDVL
jgi:16S rRNA (cytidine1402-2'-O)-methyltransferase